MRITYEYDDDLVITFPLPEYGTSEWWELDDKIRNDAYNFDLEYWFYNGDTGALHYEHIDVDFEDDNRFTNEEKGYVRHALKEWIRQSYVYPSDVDAVLCYLNTFTKQMITEFVIYLFGDSFELSVAKVKKIYRSDDKAFPNPSSTLIRRETLIKELYDGVTEYYQPVKETNNETALQN